MILRQRVLSYGIGTTALATVAAAALLNPFGGKTETHATLVDPPVVKPVSTESHAVDIVFVVDTTSSMGSLLEAAKKTVWSIASHVKSTDQNADLRVGLVAFRDTSDDYTTKPFALTSDLDAVSAELYKWGPDGGGDTNEDVAAGMDQALKMQWRPGAKRIMFVVGDAAPANRGEVATFDVLAKQARDAGIVVNAIRCGYDSETEQTFRVIASNGGGDFSTINADAGVVQIATPYDAKMAAIRGDIDGSAAIYGGEASRREYADKMATVAAAPAATKADRAAYYAKGGAADPAKAAPNDLVVGVATGTVDVDALAESDLPTEMQGKDRGEVKKELAARAEKRKADEAALTDLAKQRDAYLATHATEGGSGFDSTVMTTVDKQLK